MRMSWVERLWRSNESGRMMERWGGFLLLTRGCLRSRGSPIRVFDASILSRCCGLYATWIRFEDTLLNDLHMQQADMRRDARILSSRQNPWMQRVLTGRNQ